MDGYKDQLQKCQDIITHLKTRHVPHAKDQDKGNNVMIIEKNTTPEENAFMSILTILPEYNDSLLTEKDRFIIEELDNGNSTRAFNSFEEKGYIECFQCHFRLDDIPRVVFYALATPSIQE